VALFCGAVIPNPALAVGIPLVGVFISDLGLRSYPGWEFTYLGHACYALLGLALLRKRRNAARVGAGAVLGQTAFFLLSNFGVWWAGTMETLYPKNLNGLLACYVAGLPFTQPGSVNPFLLNGLAGDLFFSGAVFFAYARATAPATEEFALPLESRS
jgi:hypothetical protein